MADWEPIGSTPWVTTKENVKDGEVIIQEQSPSARIPCNKYPGREIEDKYGMKRTIEKKFAPLSSFTHLL